MQRLTFWWIASNSPLKPDRTPRLVMDLATALLRGHGIDVAPARTAREGDHPPGGIQVPARDFPALVQAVATAVAADDAPDGGRFWRTTPALAEIWRSCPTRSHRPGGRAEVFSVTTPGTGSTAW
jgi:hypothetical protein